MEIFEEDGDYGYFLTLMGILFQRFEIKCWNYCLMPNHTHILIETSQPNLSEAMQQLNSAYAQWWNKRKGRVGHVFQGRFKITDCGRRRVSSRRLSLHREESRSRESGTKS